MMKYHQRPRPHGNSGNSGHIKQKRQVPPLGSNISAQSAARQSQTARLAYSVRETAEKHGVSEKTVYRWIDRGLLPTSKVSRKLLIPAEAVETFIKETL